MYSHKIVLWLVLAGECGIGREKPQPQPLRFTRLGLG
jgi:hypothetical protein